MMTIDLSSLFADPDCPDCVLADALTDSGVDVPDHLRQHMKAVRFFFTHAGYHCNPSEESHDAARARCALALADAEQWAECECVEFSWYHDETYGGSDDPEEPDGCIARHPECPEAECSLWGVIDSTSECRRVIEAELAAEMRPNVPDRHPWDDDCPHDIAERLGMHYSGDINPIPHGGMWYSARDWDDWGYANALRIIDAESGGDEFATVCLLTINKPDDMRGALRYSGHDCTPGRLEQIEACESYGHKECDSEKRFNVSTRTGLNALWSHVQTCLENMSK